MSYEPHYKQTFGGIDTHVEDPSVPGGYRDTVDAERGALTNFPSFAETMATLTERFGVAKRTAYYYDDERDEYVAVPNRVVLVNPAWLGDGLDEAPRNSAGWTTASDSYSETDAMDNYGPLVALARQRGYADCFGHVWAYRTGGDVRMDVFFHALSADDPETDEPRYVLGFETGYDYFKSASVSASVIAYDMETGAVLRGLSETFSSPHRGDITERTAAWFEDMLDRAEKVGETLYEVVAEARDYEVDLTKVPLNVGEFYEALGFPPNVADAAADLVPARNRNRPTAWDLYEPLTVVLSKDYGAKVGGDALVKHASQANDLLYSPATAEQSAYRTAAEDDDLDLREQATLGDEDTVADVLRSRANSLDDAVEQSVSFRKRIKTMLDEELNSDEQDEQDAADDEVAA